MLCSILSLRAQTFVKPAVKVKDTSFAVITDKGTFQACEAELKAYQEILGKEGLPTFIVYNEWNKPEDVKKVIVKLYKKDKLEGVVFVGDIPIPMLRKAQHMTSAFKMDEKTMTGEILQCPATVSTMISTYNSIFETGQCRK